MKGKILSISMCMLLIATAASAVGTLNTDVSTSSQKMDVEWEYTYGGDEFDWFYDCIPTQDGGYVTAGLSEEDDLFYAWILKVNETGSEEWSTINYEFNGTSIEDDILVYCLQQTPDGGYIVGGLGRFYSTVYSAWIGTGYIWKVDEFGVTLWLKNFGNQTGMWYIAPCAIENFDDTGLICGGFYVGITSPTDFYLDIALFKTDFDGNLLWYQTYDLGYDWEWVRSLSKTDDGYFISGTVYNGPTGGIFNICLLKTQYDGTLEWYKIFDSGGFDYSPVKGCTCVSDGYILSGITNSYGVGGTDLWIIKTDTTGDELWNKTYGGEKNDRCYGMDTTTDEGFAFVVIKDAFSITGTKEDIWIINTDRNGELEWELIIEEDGTQWPQSIHQTTDEGFIIAGRSGALESPTADGLLLKIEAFPQLDIEISGGIGVTATVSNTGAGDALEALWEMKITGGILGLINKTSSGITDISSGNSVTLKSGLLIGLGPIEISVTIGPKVTSKSMTQFLILTK